MTEAVQVGPGQREFSTDVVIPPQRKWTAIHAVVTRADGTVEDRGVVSFTHRNFFINIVLSPLALLNGWFWERYYTWRRN